MEQIFKLSGNGAEVCVGLISKENVNKLVSAGEECNESLLNELTGVSWYDLSDVWHFSGPFLDVSVKDEKGKDINFGEFEGNLNELWKKDSLSIHRLPEELTKDDLKNNCLIITVSPEIGDWGELIVDEGTDVKKLQIAKFNPEFCSSIYTTIGFVIDGEPVYWERANDTEVNSPSFTVFDPIEKKVIIEF